MKKIMFLTVLLCLVVFAVPSNAADKDVNVINQPTVDIGSMPPVSVTGTSDVNVTNTTLPVSGDVNVTNTTLPVSGNVNVTNTTLPVSGNVNVTNTPNVEVNNTAGNPVPVDDINAVLPNDIRTYLTGAACRYGTNMRHFNGFLGSGGGTIWKTSGPYLPGAGYVWVITSVQFIVEGHDPNSYAWGKLARGSTSGYNTFVQTIIPTNVDGFGSLHMTFPDGLIVSDQAELCAYSDPSSTTKVIVYLHYAPDI